MSLQRHNCLSVTSIHRKKTMTFCQNSKEENSLSGVRNCVLWVVACSMYRNSIAFREESSIGGLSPLCLQTAAALKRFPGTTSLYCPAAWDICKDPNCSLQGCLWPVTSRVCHPSLPHTQSSPQEWLPALTVRTFTSVPSRMEKASPVGGGAGISAPAPTF